MSTLKERMLAAIGRAGISQRELADYIGITEGAVSHWCNGETTTLKGVNALKAAYKLGVNALWLVTGQGDMTDGLKPETMLLAKEADKLSADQIMTITALVKSMQGTQLSRRTEAPDRISLTEDNNENTKLQGQVQNGGGAGT